MQPSLYNYLSDTVPIWVLKYSNGIFVSGCQMVWYSNVGLKTGLKEPVIQNV